jgi:hypothetical protein
MERLIDESLASLPQVFLDKEISNVQEQFGLLRGLSDRFRSTCRVSPLILEDNSMLTATIRMVWNSCSIS